MIIKIAIEFKDETCTIYTVTSKENNFTDRTFGLRKYLSGSQILQFNNGQRVFKI